MCIRDRFTPWFGYRSGPAEFTVKDGYLYCVGRWPILQFHRAPFDGPAGAVETLAPNLDEWNHADADGPYSFALAGSTAYVTYPERGEIRRVNIDGSSLQQIVSGEARPTMIASDGTRLVWANDTRTSPESCSVVTASVDGSNRQELTALRGRCVERLRIDENFVYFQYHEPADTSVPGKDKVYRCRTDGSELTELEAAALLALDGPYVYVTTLDGVSRMPRGGGPKTVVHDGAGIAIDRDRFYFQTGSGPEGIAYIPAQ